MASANSNAAAPAPVVPYRPASQPPSAKSMGRRRVLGRIDTAAVHSHITGRPPSEGRPISEREMDRVLRNSKAYGGRLRAELREAALLGGGEDN